MRISALIPSKNSLNRIASPCIRQQLCSRVRSRDINISAANKTNFKHLYKMLQLDEVKDLPYRETIPLIVQQYKPSKGFNVDIKLPSILMLHGLFGSMQNFRSVGRKISERTGHPTGGVDLRNHGQAPHAKPHDYFTMANDVIALLEEKKWKNSILVGHSMGAKVSMIVALLRPELISKLIVIDNSPINQALDSSFLQDLIGMCQVERKLANSNLPILLEMEKIDKILDNYEKDPKVKLFLTSNINRKAKNTSSKFRIPVLSFLKDDVIRSMGEWPSETLSALSFHKPVLVMKANYSNFINQDSLKHFDIYFSNYKVKHFDCGHWIVSDKPEDFVKELSAFIETN